MTGQCLSYGEYGEPAAVIRLAEETIGDPGPGEALVRVLAASINPADLNLLEGTYPLRPPLPAVGGIEGVGVVVKAGENAASIHEGDHVLLPAGLGSWRQFAIVPLAKLILVPPEVPVGQAAMLRINPPTAWQMLHSLVKLEAGAWVIQNASNSGVGRAVIQIARHRGWRTINLVRREELVSELKALGADEVLIDDEAVAKSVAAIAGEALPKLGLNAVGGESALRMANALAPGGTIATYGGMGRQPLRVPNGLLIFKDIRWRGFWVSKWYQEATVEEQAAMFRELMPLAASGTLHAPVAATYGLEDFAKALEHAAQGQRAGKILFRPTA